MSALEKLRRIFRLDNPGDAAVLSESNNFTRRNVTQDSTLSISAAYACVRVISESIASLPLGLYQRAPNGDKVDASDDDLYRILHDRPNADMSAYAFWQAVVAVRALWGNAYVLKTYRGAGSTKALVALELLRTDWMTRKVNDDGSVTYRYTEQGKTVEYSEDRISHFRGFSLNGRVGLSVISFGAQTFGTNLAQDEAGARLYSNGLRPGGALKMPQVLKKEQRDEVRKNITDQIGGVARNGGVMILEAGMDWVPLGMPPDDAQLLQSRSFSIEEICRWFGVPPVLIGHNEKTTSWGTGIEQINLGFLTYGLQPILKSIEQEIKRSIIPVGSKMYAEFTVEGFLRADSSGRAALYGSASQNGWMTRAEIRRRENLPFIEGSDQLTAQSALLPLDLLGEPRGATPPGKIDDSAKT